MQYRFIYSDNGLLTDYSTQINNYISSPIDLSINHEQDKIFIGSTFPFNSCYFKISTAASGSMSPSVSYWTGSSYQAAIEVIDETEGLTKSGYLTWQINRAKSSWSREDTQDTSGDERVLHLGDVAIYDMYWTMIEFSSSNDVSLDWIGHKFINDNDLKVEYPSLGNTTLLGAISAGKIDWEEQEIRASRIVIEDLINGRVINDQGQIVDRRKLELMTVSKTAELIYQMLGDDYVDQRREAGTEYAKRLKNNHLNVDVTGNADLSIKERGFRQGYFTR